VQPANENLLSRQAGNVQAVASSLFSGYSANPHFYDEMIDAGGQVRPQWRQFRNWLDEVGPDEFARRWEQAQAQLYENGIAYGLYGQGDEQEGARPWNLDALPLLLPAAEWQTVSAALVQRAELLNAILADLYGPQRLLTAGWLPPEILFAHPGFQRAYHGCTPPNGRFLHLYSADLARSPEGSWWVLSDRTEAPSGVGHVLENRIVMSGMLPGLFHACQIERLAPYFIALRESLASLAPAQRENPRTVLLSKGAGTPSYFEDAYLARYLGYILVEGGDLAVRNSRVMLKTLGGLRPVDVVLRRTDSDQCDPLELVSTGNEGPVAFMQAVRTGRVAVANSLGAGIVESPVFQAFIPRLCEHLLGEPLKMPNNATWWCGDKPTLNYVLDHLDRLVLRRAFRQRSGELEFNQRVDQLPLAQLKEMLKASPGEFVAQERITRSTGPVWNAGRLTPAHIALRAYVAAGGDSYVVMQGALARTSATPRPLDLSILAGEGSQDVWIVSDQPVSQVSLLRSRGSGICLQRGGAELPSRVADNLFWLGRHLERADAHARLLRTLVSRLTDEVSAEDMSELPALLRALAKQGQIEPGFALEGMREALPAIEQALPNAVLDESQSGSLRATVTALYRTASQVRDRLSLDSWRIVHRIHRRLRALDAADEIEVSDLPAVLDQLIVRLAAINGLVMESMTRSLGWRFLDLGRRIERAQQTVSLIHSMLERQRVVPTSLLESLLEAADSSMTYRSRYLADLQVAAVLDLLLTDETNPRSVAYQLVAVSEHVHDLPRDRSQPQLGGEQRLAMTLLHHVRMADVNGLAEMFSLGQWEPLGRLLEDIDRRLPRLSDAIYHRYLIHAGPSRQLSDILPEVRS
jgi:uncharacterized circularly permuted ATP-grasp superfamily protein/uncharacterized alpha-E superfamily protein